MNKLINKLPNITLYVLLAISLVFTVMFWVGGQNDVEINGETLSEPIFTGLYLNWTYILCAIAVVTTLLIAIVRFVTNFIADPKKGLVSLLVILLFVAVFVISWFMGSDAKLEIIGYGGTDNVGFWAQYSDMCIFTAYIMAGATILTLIVTSIYSKIK